MVATPTPTRPTKAAPRTYRSPLRAKRAAETRSALVAAAHDAFVTRGWGGTAMREVAADAGVALETLYTHFPSKRALLHAVFDVAVGGDDQQVALADRAAFAAIGTGKHAERAATAARFLTAIQVRTAALAKVLREAAGADEELADTLRTARERQRADVAAAAALMMGRAATDEERDGLWAVTSIELYLLLVEDAGWSPEQYETWMAETLRRLVPSATRRRTTP